MKVINEVQMSNFNTFLQNIDALTWTVVVVNFILILFARPLVNLVFSGETKMFDLLGVCIYLEPSICSLSRRLAIIIYFKAKLNERLA